MNIRLQKCEKKHIIEAGELEVVWKYGLRFCWMPVIMAAAFWNIGYTTSMHVYRIWGKIVAKIGIVKRVDTHMLAAAISAAINAKSYIWKNESFSFNLT